VAETGRFLLEGSIDEGDVHRVTFRHRYSNPVVIKYAATRKEGDPFEVRAANVSSSGCYVIGFEPSGSDGVHEGEVVVWLVAEAGSHRFAEGGYMKAGTVSTYLVHETPDKFGGMPVKLSCFSGQPVVLHSLNTYNNRAFLSSVASSVTKDGFDVQQEAAGTDFFTGSGASTTSEVIGWVAFEPGKYNGYEAFSGWDGTPDGLDPSKPHQIEFKNSYGSIPDVVVKSNQGPQDKGKKIVGLAFAFIQLSYGHCACSNVHEVRTHGTASSTYQRTCTLSPYFQEMMATGREQLTRICTPTTTMSMQPKTPCATRSAGTWMSDLGGQCLSPIPC